MGEFLRILVYMGAAQKTNRQELATLTQDIVQTTSRDGTCTIEGVLMKEKRFSFIRNAEDR